MQKYFLLLSMLCFSWLSLSGCDDAKKYHTLPPIDGGEDADVDSDVDIVSDVIIPPDDLDASADGPEITITAPTEGETLYGDNYLIKASVVPVADPIDYASVTAYIDGTDYSMTVDTNTPNGFKITADISNLIEGTHTVRVTAMDVSGRLNYADVHFNYDRGPTISIYSPLADGRYHGGVNLSIKVSDNDGVQASSVLAVLANRDITLTQSNVSSDTANGSPLWIEFTGSVVFDDAMFDPPLTGTQRLSVSAENAVGNDAQKSVDFTVDNNGPAIDVLSHEEGQIIGSITYISAEITDPAGVLASSVYAIIGNNDVEFVIPLTEDPGTNVYEGSFDTTVLPDTFIWPALQVFATDLLGNESSVAFQLALDNQPPLLSLDPPQSMRLGKKNSDRLIECSRVFDPVGWNSANDGDLVAQVFWLRARVEDRGNTAAGAAWSPLALVNQTTVEIYVLDDARLPLVVDMSGDGICNNINPNLIPTITISGDPRETLKLNMIPLEPGGSADYRVDMVTPVLPPPCQAWGVATDPPDPLCPVVENDLDVLIWYTYDKTEPAIYGLPPFSASSPLYCTGIQFDARANNIAEGWACIAVKATDNVGNTSVSAPLRVCIDYNPYDGSTPTDCQNLLNLPDCTGTWDPGTSTVLTTPCTPQVFPNNEVRRED
ncbi:hypothetical protein KJ975_04000 [Myxococcota bacterium]|nr:hypothetical protein [Myxococcota bacterium]